MFYNNASNNASSNINLKYQAFIKRIKKMDKNIKFLEN